MSGFVQSQSLYEFNTTLAAFPGDALYALSAIAPFGEIKRRQFDSAIRPFTKLSPWLEIGRQVAKRIHLSSLTKHESGPFCVDAIYKNLDKIVAARLSKAVKQGATAVYAYEDGSLATFTMAKELGLSCFYELPIAYWSTVRALLTQEATRLPEWAITLGGGVQDSPEKLDRKSQELALADMVIVPSQFVQNSLPDWAADKPIVVSAFGTPTLHSSERTPETYSSSNRPLRVLFVGSMGQRKGLGDLFTAVKLLNRSDLELVILGSPLAPMEFYRHQLPNFAYERGRSNQEVLALMRTCDVFCLPSIVEGRALVMQEAMSQGLPLLITPNTGGSDLIQEGKNGFLAPISSPVYIAEKLAWFLDNRSQIPAMGKLAQEHACTYTWEKYRNCIIKAIERYSVGEHIPQA